MTICRKCGTSNNDNRKFCSFCNELLVADPVLVAKRDAAEQKKLKKAQKKLEAKHKRWKKAPFLLIPIGVLDLINLLICVDLAFGGITSALGNLLGSLAQNILGSTLELFGNMVYTDATVLYTVRAIAIIGAFGLLLISSVLAIVMIVRMIKWRRYRKHGSKQEQALEAQAAKAQQSAQDEQAAQMPVQEQSAENIRAAMGEQCVSYGVLGQACAHKEAYTMPKPASETDCKQLYHSVSAHLWEYDADSVRRILSAMSCSRMLLCSAGALDSASIFDNLSRAFGVAAEQYTCPAQEDASQGSIAHVLLQRDEQTGTLTHTPFAKALYTARFSPKNICLAGLSGIGADATDAVLSPLVPYFGLPEGNVALYLGQHDAESAELPEGIEEGRLVLSENLWVLSVLPEHDPASCVGGQTARYSAAIYLRNSGKAIPPEDAAGAQTVCVSVDALERAVAAAENDCYLSDELWQIIDRIEQQMLESCGVRLSNRTLRMFEKYTSVYMACGGKQQDAFDNGFAAVILPAYAEQMRALATKEDGERLSALFERTVGRDRLPMTMQVLTEMGLV